MSLVIKKFIKRCLKNTLGILHPVLSSNSSIAFTLLYFLYVITYRVGAVDKYYFTSSRYIVAVLNSGRQFIEFNALNKFLYKVSSSAMLSFVLDVGSHYEREDTYSDLLKQSQNSNRSEVLFNRLQGIFFFPQTSNSHIAEIFGELSELAKLKYSHKESFQKSKSKKKSIIYLSECYSQEKIELLMYLKFHDLKKYDVFVYSKYYPYALAKEIPGLNFIRSLEDISSHSYDYLIDCNGYMMKNLDIYEIGRVAKTQITAFNDLIDPFNPYIDCVLSYDYFKRHAKLNNSKYIAMPDKASLNLMPSQLCDLPDELPLEKNGFITFGIPSGVEKINKGADT